MLESAIVSAQSGSLQALVVRCARIYNIVWWHATCIGPASQSGSSSLPLRLGYRLQLSQSESLVKTLKINSEAALYGLGVSNEVLPSWTEGVTLADFDTTRMIQSSRAGTCILFTREWADQFSVEVISLFCICSAASIVCIVSRNRPTGPLANDADGFCAAA